MSEYPHLTNNTEQPLYVIIKMPIKRPENFTLPPCTLWNETKEQLLWEYLNQNKGRNIDWNYLSEELEIPTPYLIKFASFLYEAQLLKLRNQWNLTENLNKSVEDAEMDEQTDPELDVLPNLDHLQAKLIDEPLLNPDTQRSTPFVTPLSSPMIRSRELNPDPLHSTEPDVTDQLSEEIAKIRLQHSPHMSPMRLDDREPNFAIQNNLKEESIPPSVQVDSNGDNDSNSIGSPYSDLSDESVTQSQLEDAFLSKFNKYSIFRKSNFYQ